MIINWNKAPIGCTHVFVPSDFKVNTDCMQELPVTECHYEKWDGGKVYQWDVKLMEWDLLAYDSDWVNEELRAKNPNIGEQI